MILLYQNKTKKVQIGYDLIIKIITMNVTQINYDENNC